MRLRINSVALVGTSREVAFEPGLNVIEGPISTGKTALMRLLTVLLGGPYDGINPEVDESVSELAGEFLIEERTYSIVRRLVQTDTAPVQGEERRIVELESWLVFLSWALWGWVSC